ncbi:MAG: hypothetical protein RIR26_1854 [Pseudomonadota bacterium]|jgi:hypothetical protein
MNSKQRKTVLRNSKLSLALVTALACVAAGSSQAAHAATAQINGQAALVGEFISNLPPAGQELKGLRVPLGLTLEGRSSSNLGIFLDLRFNANQFPRTAVSLGNTEALNTDAELKGDEVRQPFTLEGGRGERREPLYVNQAFVQYDSSEAGRFRAGRMPRHWGLGIWMDDEWKPEGGTRSSSDGVSYTVDFPSALSATAYWEKISEGRLSSRSDDADALTMEILIADELTDASSSGLSRRLGLAFSKYDHAATSTELRIYDIFGVFSFGRMGLEGEINWPDGSTKSLSYASLGGATEKQKCPELSNPKQLYVSCDSQKVNGLNLLLRARYQLSGGVSAGDKSARLSQTEAARSRRPTSQVAESQIVSLVGGYSKGDSDAFADATDRDNSITGVPMHPNVRPAFLMFNPLSSNIAGMPGALVQNVLFARADYSFESPSFGMLTPAVIFARLDALNKSGVVTASKVGTVKNVGFEVDVNYSYRTMDGVRFGLDGGLWVPGGAWETSGVKPETVYGVRATAATFF